MLVVPTLILFILVKHHLTNYFGKFLRDFSHLMLERIQTYEHFLLQTSNDAEKS